MTLKVEANGQTFEFPDGTTNEQISEAMDQFFTASQNADALPQPEATPTEKIAGAAEVARSMVSGIVAEPASGIAGLGAAGFQGLKNLVTGDDSVRPSDAADAVRQGVSDSITGAFAPESEEGKAQLDAVATALTPIAQKLKEIEDASAEIGFEASGGNPAAAALSATIPTLALELVSLGVGSKFKSAAKSVPDAKKTDVIAAADDVEVPVLTTDLFEPTSKIGKLFQDFSEALGPIGTGGQRAKQQASRQNAVTGLADELEIELDSDFASNIVSSLNTKNKQVLKEAGDVRASAVNKLNEFGDVPVNNIDNAIDAQLTKEIDLREAANPTITKLLENYSDAFSKSVNFEQMKNLRTQVIKARNAFDRAEDTSPRDAAQAIKSAIDKDMLAFARKNDRVAARDWLSSNRKFAAEADLTKRTELKRILDTGETTPEQVLNILSRGRPSELNRLNNALTAKGRINAQKALVQKALIDSKFFDIDKSPNPDAFANALNKPNFQKAKNIFFEGAGKKRLDGMSRVLNATRRAQEATTSVRTGEKAVLPVAGIAASTAIVNNPLVGIPATVASAALTKAYESRAFRNALLKLSGTKPKSKQELKILEGIMTTLVAEVEAAKSQQEQE